MKRSSRVLLSVSALALALQAASPASADLIPQFQSVTPSVNHPGDYDWSYSVVLTAGSTITGASNSSNFVSIYDFPGYVPASGLVIANSSTSATSFWTLSEQYTGLTNPFISAPDDAGKLNASFVYHDPALTPVNGSIVPVLTFTLTSTQGTVSPNADVVYSGSTLNSQNGTSQGNAGYVQGPLGVSGSLPEPASLSLLALGGLGLLSRRRR